MSSQMKLTLANGFFHVTIMSCNRIEGQLFCYILKTSLEPFLSLKGIRQKIAYFQENKVVSS